MAKSSLEKLKLYFEYDMTLREVKRIIRKRTIKEMVQ